MTSEKMYKIVRFLIFFSCFTGAIVPIGSLLIFLYTENTEIGKIVFSNVTAGMLWLKIAGAGFVLGVLSMIGAVVADVFADRAEEKEKKAEK